MELEIDILAIEASERMAVAALARGDAILDDTMASIGKLKVSETLQKITELKVDVIGSLALVDQSATLFGGEQSNLGIDDVLLTPVAHYLNMRACTIFGGSSEIQHNILAKVALGL